MSDKDEEEMNDRRCLKWKIKTKTRKWTKEEAEEMKK